ncbi:hypothetical protein E2C01_002103 [Portunus trituberculatus]|uniref:Uncharacterized protein n=1 Tax=Portunus trituberculatus TaxID=210409 RepID=A0A5B7CJH7_PORTR|nr:hypothetical protein [Portunus trituberculatus]
MTILPLMGKGASERNTATSSRGPECPVGRGVTTGFSRGSLPLAEGVGGGSEACKCQRGSVCWYQNKGDRFSRVTNHRSSAQYRRPWGWSPRGPASLPPPPLPPLNARPAPPSNTPPIREPPRVPTRNEHTLTRPFLIPGHSQNKGYVATHATFVDTLKILAMAGSG